MSSQDARAGGRIIGTIWRFVHRTIRPCRCFVSISVLARSKHTKGDRKCYQENLHEPLGSCLQSCCSARRKRSASGRLMTGLVDALYQAGGLWFGWSGRLGETPSAPNIHLRHGRSQSRGSLATTAAFPMPRCGERIRVHDRPGLKKRLAMLCHRQGTARRLPDKNISEKCRLIVEGADRVMSSRPNFTR
ncbi:hypothetical protein V1291_005647 [Nitrobacteraceae bacterium AZCC 1564]